VVYEPRRIRKEMLVIWRTVILLRLVKMTMEISEVQDTSSWRGTRLSTGTTLPLFLPFTYDHKAVVTPRSFSLLKYVWQKLMLPNVAIQFLALLSRIREVTGSKLGPETGYSEDSRSLSRSLHANAGILYWNTRRLLFQHPFQFIIHKSPFLSTLHTQWSWKGVAK
jgi:hypothetical protein